MEPYVVQIDTNNIKIICNFWALTPSYKLPVDNDKKNGISVTHNPQCNEYVGFRGINFFPSKFMDLGEKESKR